MLQSQFTSTDAQPGLTPHLGVAESGLARVRRISEEARSQRVLGAVLWCYLIGTVLWISS